MAAVKTGRQRLTFLLCGLSASSCLVLMAAVVLLYGAPYNPMWWWVMAAIAFASLLLPIALVSAIEWVMEGYRQQADE